MGYMRAHRRLEETYSRAFVLRPGEELLEHDAEDIRIALFEALNWLDALLLVDEAAARLDPDLHGALRFVRGRVHHVWANAIEYRRDVPFMQGPSTPGSGPSPPLLI